MNMERAEAEKFVDDLVALMRAVIVDHNSSDVEEAIRLRELCDDLVEKLTGAVV